MSADNPVEAADIALGARLASERKNPVVKNVAELGAVGDQEPLYFIAAILTVGGLAGRNRDLRDAGISMLAAVGVADISKRITKKLVQRTRPHATLDEGRYELSPGGAEEKPEQSFPSGHAAGAVAAARAISRFYPTAGPVAALFAAAVSLARIAKGAHWPLDVVGGCVIGWVAERISCRMIGRWFGPSCGRRRRW